MSNYSDAQELQKKDRAKEKELRGLTYNIAKELREKREVLQQDDHYMSTAIAARLEKAAQMVEDYADFEV